MTCPYDGRYKVVSENTEHTTPLLCRAHAEDWVRVFPGSYMVEPRLFHIETVKCTGDWPLPAEAPT